MKQKLSLAAITLASSLSLPVYSQQSQADICDPSVYDFCDRMYEYCENREYASRSVNLEDKVVQASYKTESPQNLKELVDNANPRVLEDRLLLTLMIGLGFVAVYWLFDEYRSRRNARSGKDNK